MKNKSSQHRVPIRNKHTNEVRYSAPVNFNSPATSQERHPPELDTAESVSQTGQLPDRVEEVQVDSAPADQALDTSAAAKSTSEAHACHQLDNTDSIEPPTSTCSKSEVLLTVTLVADADLATTTDQIGTELAGDGDKPEDSDSRIKLAKDGASVDASATSPEPAVNEKGKARKPKPPPMTIETFIKQAYARKGQRVGMNKFIEESLSKSPKLNELQRQELFRLGEEDRILAVPRQLLLAAMAIESHPIPRGFVVEYVLESIRRHPIYSSSLCKQALDLSAVTPSTYGVFQSILTFNSTQGTGGALLVQGELEQLRSNALNLMAVWLFYAKSVRLEEVSNALLQAVWKPAASELASEVQRIRTLTDISDPAAIGWTAELYLQRASEAQQNEVRTQREMVTLREELLDLRAELAVATSKIDSLSDELERVRQDSVKLVTELKQKNQLTHTHLSHDLEVMRGRILESLRQNLERLETGLAALNREPPRTTVMVERAEIVIESLKAELRELQEN